MKNFKNSFEQTHCAKEASNKVLVERPGTMTSEWASNGGLCLTSTATPPALCLVPVCLRAPSPPCLAEEKCESSSGGRLPHIWSCTVSSNQKKN